MPIRIIQKFSYKEDMYEKRKEIKSMDTSADIVVGNAVRNSLPDVMYTRWLC